VKRALIFVLLTNLLLAACKLTQGPQSAHQSQPSTEGASSFAVAAAKITDACSLMPADFVQRLVPGASAPQSERFPPRCTVRNGKSALEITMDTGPADPINGAEFIPGLAQGGYVERLSPNSPGDVYLTVILGQDSNQTNHNLHVEVAGWDGKDHKDDAIAIARDTLAHLH